MLLVAAFACCPTPAAAKPALVSSERAAQPGDRVVIAARGLRAGARVRLVLGGRTLKRSRVGARGRLRLAFRVPSRPAGHYRLSLLGGGRALRLRFRILARPQPPTPAPLPLSPPQAPAALPPPPEPATLVAAGDIACRPDLTESATECRHARTATLVESLAPDAVAVLGDLQYQYGELANFQASYEPTWGRFKAITHPVPGNHEYEGVPERDSAPGYYGYFGAAAGEPAAGYYRRELADWTLFALNSGALGYTRTRADLPDDCWPVSCAVGSAQETWLRAQLASVPPGRCVLAFWHHPRLSSGFGGAHQPHPETEPLVDALRDHGAELILTGHSHNYERFAIGSLTQFVVGTGGRSLHTNTGPPPLTTTLRTDVFGVLELTLAPAAWSSRFIAENGVASDPASGTC